MARQTETADDLNPQTAAIMAALIGGLKGITPPKEIKEGDPEYTERPALFHAQALGSALSRVLPSNPGSMPTMADNASPHCRSPNDTPGSSAPGTPGTTCSGIARSRIVPW